MKNAQLKSYSKVKKKPKSFSLRPQQGIDTPYHHCYSIQFQKSQAEQLNHEIKSIEIRK